MKICPKCNKLKFENNVAVVSPPFEQSLINAELSDETAKKMAMAMYEKHGRTFTEKDLQYQIQLLKNRANKNYGDNPSNIGNLPYKQIVGVVSPPYQDSLNDGLREEDREKYQEWKRASKSVGINYSQNPENIGNLKDTGSIVGITSPPYENTQHDSSQDIDLILERLPKDSVLYQRIKNPETRGKAIGEYLKGKYSDNPQNIGNLKDTSIENLKDFQAFSKAESFVGITSPPYDNRLSDGGKDKEKWEQWHKLAIEKRETATKYNSNLENIGNQNNQNYLSEMLKVYKSASEICPIICTVTKNPTRAGKLRRLDLDTAKLLELAGYTIVDYHRAILFKTFEQSTLTGETKKEHKGRLSFFKRLSLQKGNQASQWEDIIIGIRK